MASLSDVRPVLGEVGVIPFAKRVYQQVSEDNVFTWGAALAYSWMFAVFPFLVFLLSLIPLLPDRVKPNIEEEVNRLADQAMAPEAGKIFKDQVKNVLSKPSAGGFLSFGLILTIWAASGGMAMTMAALDKAYDIDKGRPFVRQRFIAIGLTIVVATLFILVMVLMPIGTAVIKWLSSQGELFGWLMIFLNVARYALALAMLFTALMLIYHFGPSFKQKFHVITPGAVFCLAVWLLLGAAFKLYMTKFGGAASYNKTYGAVAGAAILLLFFYIDALVLLIGAEINSEIDFAILNRGSGGSGTGRPVAAEAVDSPVLTTEQKALAHEIYDRQQPKPLTELPKTAVPAPPTFTPNNSSAFLKVCVALSGIWALTFAARLLRRPFRRVRRPDKQIEAARLRATYPMTYSILAGSRPDGRR